MASEQDPNADRRLFVVILSGEAAFKITVGTLAVAITNGAADTLTRSLAVEMGPIHVNAISPRRVGQSEGIAGAVLVFLTTTFLTGVTLKVDGGQHLFQPAATAR